MGENPERRLDPSGSDPGLPQWWAGAAQPIIRRMTTEQPTAPRLLRRRGDDRVLGGVASGLADYFNVDPLLVRIGFVGLMVFNGLGLLFYLLAWLLIPTDTDNQSVVQRLFGGNGVGGRLAAVVLIVLGAIFVYNLFPQIEPRQGFVELAVIALVIIAIGAILFRRAEPSAAVASGDAAVGASASTAPPAPPVVVRRPSPPPSPLGWYTFGAMLVGIGLLALATVVAGVAIDPARYFGLALVVLGIGLVVGTWLGHARPLILLGILLLPFAFAASLITVPIEGGFGSHYANPTSAEDLANEYRLVGGQIALDLTRMEDGGEPIEVIASVAMGDILVVLPEDAGLELDAAVGGGAMRILGTHAEGTNIEDHQLVEGDGPQFVLDLEAGLGYIRVETRQTER
jgi:phage shock protein PspC (stress-responsive transcriptional regulator)